MINLVLADGVYSEAVSSSAPIGAINYGTVIAWMVGTGLPLLVALVSNEKWSSRDKGLALAALSILTGIGSQWIDAANSHTPFNWLAVVTSVIFTFVIGHVTYKSVLSHLPLTASLKAIGSSPAVEKVVDGELDNLKAQAPDLESDIENDGFSGAISDFNGGKSHLDEEEESPQVGSAASVKKPPVVIPPGVQNKPKD